MNICRTLVCIVSTLACEASWSHNAGHQSSIPQLLVLPRYTGGESELRCSLNVVSSLHVLAAGVCLPNLGLRFHLTLIRLSMPSLCQKAPTMSASLSAVR